MHARSVSAILKKNYKVLSVFVQYIHGTVLVEGKSRDVTKALSQREGPKTFFDAVIEIPISEASEQLADLTTIENLLR